jgi:ABC-type nickel/cobalt efflux system permease component RcnA
MAVTAAAILLTAFGIWWTARLLRRQATAKAV